MRGQPGMGMPNSRRVSEGTFRRFQTSHCLDDCVRDLSENHRLGPVHLQTMRMRVKGWLFEASSLRMICFAATVSGMRLGTLVLLLYPQCQERCLAQRRSSVNICRINERMNEQRIGSLQPPAIYPPCLPPAGTLLLLSLPLSYLADSQSALGSLSQASCP